MDYHRSQLGGGGGWGVRGGRGKGGRWVNWLLSISWPASCKGFALKWVFSSIRKRGGNQLSSGGRRGEQLILAIHRGGDKIYLIFFLRTKKIIRWKNQHLLCDKVNKYLVLWCLPLFSNESYFLCKKCNLMIVCVYCNYKTKYKLASKTIHSYTNTFFKKPI